MLLRLLQTLSINCQKAFWQCCVEFGWVCFHFFHMRGNDCSPPPIPLQKGDRYAASMERRKEKLMPVPNGISPAGGEMGGGDYCSRFLFLTLATMPRSIIIALATSSIVAATVLMLCSTSSFEKRITLKPVFSKAACRILSFF